MSYRWLRITLREQKLTFSRLASEQGVPGSINPDYPLEAWHKTQSVNLHSTFYAARECARIFKAQGSGSFIATTSISARIVNVPYDQPAYNSSKAAVVHFCRSLARDWRNFARVNTISPG